MTPEAQKELEGYTQFISEFDFELSKGQLNVSSFMGNLFQCLAIDRQRPPPCLSEMLQALFDLVEHAGPDLPAGAPGLTSEPVLDWRPEMAEMYPGGKAIMIHLASLIHVGADWVEAIGQLVPDRATDREQAYLAWPRREWHLTNTFLQRFHSQLWSVCRDVDLKASKDQKFSSFEALSLAKRLQIDFNSATEQLRTRNMGFLSAVDRVDQAIDAGFPLEAITICESLISACFHHSLTANGDTNPPEMFAQLIHRFRQANCDAQGYPARLVDEIDTWRRSRNDAMHLFVSRSLMETVKSQEEFIEKAKRTAEEGRILCDKLIEWFQYESVFMLQTDFNLKGPVLN